MHYNGDLLNLNYIYISHYVIYYYIGLKPDW